MIKLAKSEDDRVTGQGVDNDPLFQAYCALEPALRRFVATRVRNTADTEDVLQDLVARILSRDPAVAVDNKTAFLFSIASNLLKDRDRRRVVRRQGEHVTLDNVEIPDTAALQDQIVDSRQRMERFLTALNTLSAKERDVFVRHRMEGQTLLHVAESTGFSVTQVRRILEQAMARLSRKVWKD